jgi:hypothetical protein
MRNWFARRKELKTYCVDIEVKNTDSEVVEATITVAVKAYNRRQAKSYVKSNYEYNVALSFKAK